MPGTNQMFVRGFQRYFLIAILVTLLITLLIFINPFIIDLLVAGVIVAAVWPAHRHLIAKIPFSRSLAAAISMLLIIVIILLPFTLFGFFVANQAGDAYGVVRERIEEIVQNNDVSDPLGIIQSLPFHDRVESALEYLPISTADLLNTAGDVVGSISSFLLSRTTNILKSISLLVLHVIVFLMALFFMLKEGDRLVKYLRGLIPLSKEYRQELFGKLAKLSYGIIYGIFGAAILQGLLVGVGFSIAGINNPAFWGFLAALASPVPYVGTAVIWVPAVIAVTIGGNYLTAFLLTLWCLLIVGTADNIIKPFLIGSSTRLNPMALLLVLLGGTLTFGLKGIFFGPFLLTVTLAFLHIYKLEYKEVLSIEDMPIPKKKPFLDKAIRKLKGKPGPKRVNKKRA
jgi:predicted PurR-regulated permease PerM